jgi:hypothetical protein
VPYFKIVNTLTVLTLPLFVALVRADNANHTAAPHYFAVLAHFFD